MLSRSCDHSEMTHIKTLGFLKIQELNESLLSIVECLTP